MVETLGIIIDRRPKGRPRKRENWTIEKIGCVFILIKKIEREDEKWYCKTWPHNTSKKKVDKECDRGKDGFLGTNIVI